MLVTSLDTVTPPVFSRFSETPEVGLGGGSTLPVFHRRVWRSQEVNVTCLVSHTGLWNPDLQAPAHSLSFSRRQVPWPQSGDDPHPRG